jgi:hypothetical protein
MGFDFFVGRQHINESISAQLDILEIQIAKPSGLANQVIAIYDNMDGHFGRQ